MGTNKFAITYTSDFSPSIDPSYLGAPARSKYINGIFRKCNVGYNGYFQKHRSEEMSRYKTPPYNWGLDDSMYSPKPTSISRRSYQSPGCDITTIDKIRMAEVDGFYNITQMHRDQYKDSTGKLHPVSYFKLGDYKWQCPSDPISTYFKYPEYNTGYKQPLVLPLTLNRTVRLPDLPDRTLAGRYSPGNDVAYKR